MADAARIAGLGSADRRTEILRAKFAAVAQAEIDALQTQVESITLGSWTAYTPTVAGWGLGNGNVAGRWAKVGKIVTFQAQLFAGTTTTFAAALTISLPFSANTALTNDHIIGAGEMSDSSTGIIAPVHLRIQTTTAVPFAMGALNQINNAGLTATVPWTWAVNDYVQISGTYEAA